jgi:hypothetical protein
MRRHRVRSTIPTAVVAAAAGAAALLGVAAPAVAATAVSQPEDGATLHSRPTIVGAFDMSRPIDRFSVSVAATGPQEEAVSVAGTCDGPPPGFSCSADRRTVSFSWSPVLGRNGPYRITGTAVHDRDGLLDREETAELPARSFTLVEPPATPTGLRATVDPGTREVTLTWRANGEADLIGYVVYRARGDGDYRQAAALTGVAGTTVSWRDPETAAAGGTYRWFVAAVRNGSSGDDSTIAVSSASTPVTAAVPDPPGAATTTTSAPGVTPPTTAPAAPVVDASAFRSVSRGPRLELPPPPPPPDPGFQPTLPYPSSTAAPTTTAPATEAALPVSPALEAGPAPRRTALAFFAGALVLVMCSMHLRWLLVRTSELSDARPRRSRRA